VCGVVAITGMARVSPERWEIPDVPGVASELTGLERKLN
jgi:hypothetical protein